MSYRLRAFDIENFLRIEELRAEPGDAGLLCVVGRNGAGKSSTINALMYAFGGAKHRPKDPVHTGADAAEIRIELDGERRMTLRKRVTAGGTETLTIEADDGMGPRQPQKWLDELVGRQFLDPLAFLGQKPKEQRETLLRCLGVGDALDVLEVERERVYGERRDLGRDLKQSEAELRGVGEGRPKVPDAVDASAVLLKMQAAQAVEGRRAAAQREVEACRRMVQDAEAEIARLEEALRVAQSRRAQGAVGLENAQDAFDALPPPADTWPLEETLRSAEARNAAHAQASAAAQQWDRLSGRVATLRTEHGAREARLGEIEAAKAAAVEGCQLPIEGLGISDEGVTYQGYPLQDVQDSQRLRVALAVAAALSPGLRAVWLKGGEALDVDSLREVGAWAEEQDVLVVMERVGDAAGERCIVIEAGRVAT